MGAHGKHAAASKRLARRMWLVAHYPHLREEVQSVAAKHRRAMDPRSSGDLVDFLRVNASPENFTREGLEKQKQQREAARAQHHARCAARRKQTDAE